jgi:glycosyltransferase involved in cell wall biosynthesis
MPKPSPGEAALRLTVDARYLKRPGIGISVYLDAAINALCRSDASVTLLTDDQAHAEQLAVTYPEAATATIAERSGFRWEQLGLRRYLRQHKPDVHLAGANYGLPAFFRGPTRMALVVHDLIPVLMPRVYLTNRPAWAAKYLLSVAAAVTAVDLVIANSHQTAADVRRILRVHNVAVLYPSLPDQAGGSAPLRDERAPERYFVYSGGYDPRKNVTQLLSAVDALQADHPGVGLVCLGSVPAPLAELMDRRGPLVLRTGYVSDQDKSGWLDGAAGLVYPSRFEGFGLPIVEAFLHGIPAVTGTGGSLREVAGDAAVFVDVDEPTSIARGMSRALDVSTREALLTNAESQLKALRHEPSVDDIAGLLGELVQQDRSH